MTHEDASSIIVGIDLSGPTGFSRTALAGFLCRRETLEHLESHEGVDDRKILDILSGLAKRGNVHVRLDAPLSYNIGGGDRPGDKALRKRIVARGMRSGSIMPSTMSKMVYLTLRGFAVSRLLAGVGAGGRVRVAEVHPGAAMALRGAPVEDVKGFAKHMACRISLFSWLENQGLKGAPNTPAPSDHSIAALAAALAAWKWSLGKPAWIEPARPPFHPYDYMC
ncbi:MAG: DUF429 domain-containing protein [Desulfobacterales bacterium]|nr:DUF429 domain-containing protein [Desulfobacterales bacterium]